MKWGDLVFWSAVYVLLLCCLATWLGWIVAPVVGDPEFRANAFQELIVLFGWTSTLLLMRCALKTTPH